MYSIGTMEMDPTFCDPNHILQSSIENCKNEEEDMDMEQYEFPKDEIEEQEIESLEETFEDEFQLQVQDQVELEILNHRERRRNFTKQMFRFVNVAIVGLAMFAAVLRPMEEKIARRAEPRSLGIQDIFLGVTPQQRFLENNYYDAAYNEKDDDDDAAVDGEEEDNGDDAVVVEYDDMTDDANDTAAYYDDITAIGESFYIGLDYDKIFTEPFTYLFLQL